MAELSKCPAASLPGDILKLLASVAQPYVANVPYWLKLDLVGSSLRDSFALDVLGSPGTYSQLISVTDGSLASGSVGLVNLNQTGQAGRNARFGGPAISVTLPQDWSAVTQQAGRPGLIWDKVTPARTGTGSLQLFGGNPSFIGYAAQGGTTVTPGTTYQASGWMKTTTVTSGIGNTAKIVLIERPSGTETTVGTQTGNQDWTRYTATVTLRPDTTSLDVRVLLQGNGTANFDDLTVAPPPSLTMTLSTTAAPFGTGLGPDGAASDQADVGAGYVDGDAGAYYVRGRAAANPAVVITVTSNRAWSGSVAAVENTGTAGMRVSQGSLRWRLGDMSTLTEAQGGAAFTGAANGSVFDAASSCASGTAKNAGTFTYNFDYSLRLLWTDAPGSFNVVVTYTASQ